MTQIGYMCFSPNVTYFNDTCNNETMKALGYNQWIILNPFDKTASNEIIDEVKNNPDKNVTGLIFETN
jgi:hypothetical protein